MNTPLRFTLALLLLAPPVTAQRIVLEPLPGQMVCSARAGHLNRQVFALGLPETIGSSEGMILNFPEVNIQWQGPDANGALRHTWRSEGKVEYLLTVTPYVDYVDAEMTVRNLGRSNWTNVFSFNCLNPVNAPQFQDWTLERTWMSKNGQPFRMDGTTRINNGLMKTVQFYVNEGVTPVSPFVNGFQATSPDRTDDSWIVTMSEDGASYMAATSPKSCFLFDNLDRCCIHSATNFGSIPAGGEATTTSRFYLARGTLDDFLLRFDTEIRQKDSSDARVLMCWGRPWSLADTTQWPEVYRHLDIQKIYIGDISSRTDTAQTRRFVRALMAQDIKIAVELGGLLDWHADKGDRAGEASFQQDWANVKPLIDMIREVDPSRSIDMLDMDGPIRRMLFPNNVKANHHTIATAVHELFEVAKLWRDSIPGIELNLLTNFPNWAWGDTPAYFAISGERNGYGQYKDVLDAVQAKSLETGIHFDGLTVDNPYDYAMGRAQTNQPAEIAGVDWMQRLAELDIRAREMGLKVNMIFNTNGARTAQMYSEQTLAFMDLYHQRVPEPDGYWIQSWYQLPDAWLPEEAPYTMTNLTLEALKKLGRVQPSDPPRALLEPADGRVYHGVQYMTFDGGEPIAGYLSALNDSTIQPAVRGLFFSIPGTRGPAQSLRQLSTFLADADRLGFIPELSLFLVSDVATDTVIATSTQYDAVIDSIITLCKNYGKAMFLRIGGEFNGKGDGWNGGGYTPHHYVTMFRKITDMFDARGFRDSIANIWCYYPAAANDFDSVDVNGALWYPGDEYVDWFGLDLFDPQDFDLALPDYDRRGITRKGKSERFLAMARAKGKPVYMSETSAKGMNISADAADSQADWDAWFAKFWEFIAAHPEIKGYSYINANWPVGAYPGWGDARINNSPLLSKWYRDEMKKAKYIHLPWSGTTAASGPGGAAAALTLHPSYPNPARTATTIVVELSASSALRVDVYDALGRRVRTLDAGHRSAGLQHLHWDGRHDNGVLAHPGIYHYRAYSGDAVATGRIVLLR
ncbi:MAG: T9SS type A sorting domain-containing protein [Bacteroidia bacterium]|nr:T9SS type A sorting domain-containing protein [Bacteroidia bacterium]